MNTDLPFVDEQRTTVEAPLEAVWRGLRRFVDRMLAVNAGRVLTRVLGTHPPAGFEISEEVPPLRLALSGRHRFSHYLLVFELDPQGQQTVLRALTYARFPGPHGGVYRVLVIGTRLHVAATQRLLDSIRRACLEEAAN